MATTSSSKRQLVHTSNTYQSNSDLTVGGDLFVNGATTTIDTANLLVEDKNIIIGNVSSPSDTTADGGGITLKGASDYTINWTNSTNQWYFNQGINITGQLDVSTNLNVSGYGTLAGLDINGNSQFDGAVTVGVNDTGHDVIFYGATAARYLKWNQAEDKLNLRDNVQVTFGNSNDLEIRHDSSNNNNYIQSNNGRNLFIEANGISLRSQAGENMITATGDGAVALHYDAASHLQTTQTGVNITGNLSASSLTVDGSPQAGEVRFSRSGINNSSYTMLCTVAGDNNASIIDMTITGTSTSVVVNSSFEILVNHYQDIHVKSVSGDYKEVTLRITSNENEDFSIEAKHNGSTTTTIEVCIFPRAGETITPTTTDPNYTGTEYVHTATEGFRFGGTDGGTESVSYTHLTLPTICSV